MLPNTIATTFTAVPRSSLILFCRRYATARAPFHDRNTASIAFSSCARGSAGKSSPVSSRITSLNSLGERPQVVGVEVGVLRVRRPSRSSPRRAGPRTARRGCPGRSCRTSGRTAGTRPTRTARSTSAWPGPATERSFSPRFRTVSIMPGMENLAPRRTETSSGSASSPRRLPMAASSACRCVSTSSIRPAGNAALLQVGQARLGGDREARRDGQAHVRHLGQVGALAAEQVLHLPVALVEVVDELGRVAASFRCLHTIPSDAEKSLSTLRPR